MVKVGEQLLAFEQKKRNQPVVHTVQIKKSLLVLMISNQKDHCLLLIGIMKLTIPSDQIKSPKNLTNLFFGNATVVEKDGKCLQTEDVVFFVLAADMGKDLAEKRKKLRTLTMVWCLNQLLKPLSG